ncbi:DUF4169 family protein [Phaeovulum sp.]|uniref:DUF4169 family protein n=1 Tax=Phaeovulum sp. TaxID=2934796 RepID=UPI0039E34D93
MPKVVNLRQAKKALARLKKGAQGSENASKFGRTKAQKLLEKATADRAHTTLDAHKREDP